MAIARVLIVSLFGLAVLLFPVSATVSSDSPLHAAVVPHADGIHNAHSDSADAPSHAGVMHHSHHHADHSHETLAMSAALALLLERPVKSWQAQATVMDIPVRPLGLDRPPKKHNA